MKHSNLRTPQVICLSGVCRGERPRGHLRCTQSAPEQKDLRYKVLNHGQWPRRWNSGQKTYETYEIEPKRRRQLNIMFRI